MLVSPAFAKFASCRRLIRAKLHLLLRDEGGQATVEYILILSVVVVGAAEMARRMTEALDSGIRHLGGQLELDLKTGRVPASVWKN